MKKTIGLLCVIALLGALLVPGMGTATGAVTLTEVDMIGVMPSDYVGTLTIESVNTFDGQCPDIVRGHHADHVDFGQRDSPRRRSHAWHQQRSKERDHT